MILYIATYIMLIILTALIMMLLIEDNKILWMLKYRKVRIMLLFTLLFYVTFKNVNDKPEVFR